ncbi:MAG: hypothetical protein U9N62_07340 [Thermotogota bacterium]|nr:hypothetical protein [Thermotogota bacterium]
MKKPLFSVLLIIFVMLFLTSCGEVPEKDDFTVSTLVDFKLANYKTAEFKFDNVSDFLENDSLEGNMISITYSGKNGGYAKIVSARTTKRKGVYYLWGAFAKENNALFKSSFTSIPFLMGEYKAQEGNLYVESWFKEKWFFYLESDSSEELETIRIQLIDFFENPEVINESVIEL